jgi:hypothetical protein
MYFILQNTVGILCEFAELITCYDSSAEIVHRLRMNSLDRSGLVLSLLESSKLTAFDANFTREGYFRTDAVLQPSIVDRLYVGFEAPVKGASGWPPRGGAEPKLDESPLFDPGHSPPFSQRLRLLANNLLNYVTFEPSIKQVQSAGCTLNR